MASLSSINILFRADLTQFSSEMQNVTRQLRRTGQEMQQLGKSLSFSLTLPIVGLGVASVKTFADLEKLQKGRDGIVKGFDEANKMFGGNLPEISYKTQERTLALIDAKIESLKNPQAKVEE